MSGRGFPISFALMRELARFPGTLLAICMALMGLSLIAVRSASMTPAGTFLPYMDRQVIWITIGLVVFLVVAFFPYDQLGRRSAFLYLLGIVALLAVFVFGIKVGGARRWFSLGPVRAQPSELMKYLLVIALAHAVARRGAGVRTWGGLLEAGVLTGIPFGLVLLQPDLGTALTYVPILLAMVIAAGARWRHLATAAALGVASAPLAWLFVLHGYQKLRILSFLGYGDNVAQAGGYQTAMSEIAIGSGGFFGRGFLQGTQGPLGFLPERHTDFIYAVVCEDFGLVGGVVVLALFAYLICTLAQIAQKTRDMEGKLIVVGVATITLVQVVVNVGMALGVMPVTGLTLPLVSYGGSSLIASMFGFGLVASVARRRRVVFA